VSQVKTTPGAGAGEAPRGSPGRALLLLAAATGMAAAATVAVLAFVARADFLTAAAGAVADLVRGHRGLAVLAAASPLLAFLLVGYAHMQRAIRRRAARKAATGVSAPR